jgi:hypothetical protein
MIDNIDHGKFEIKPIVADSSLFLGKPKVCAKKIKGKFESQYTLNDNLWSTGRELYSLKTQKVEPKSVLTCATATDSESVTERALRSNYLAIGNEIVIWFM